MKQPLFSIATPCFNSAKTIERTIRSVLAQECKDYEYIIVDGGSTDGTIDIIKKYEPLFEGRMHWNSEPDKGLYDAFNKGIERSTGVYCWNVNSDDYIEDNALKVLSDYIKSYEKIDVISGGMHFRGFDGGILKDLISTKVIEDFCFRKNGMGVNHPATVVRREIYQKFGAFDIRFKVCADIDWFNRIKKNGVEIYHLSDIITNMSDGGVSNQFAFKKNAKDWWLMLSKKYDNRIIRIYHFVKWIRRYLKTKGKSF